MGGKGEWGVEWGVESEIRTCVLLAHILLGLRGLAAFLSLPKAAAPWFCGSGDHYLNPFRGSNEFRQVPLP